jgi:hypothetical protein
VMKDRKKLFFLRHSFLDFIQVILSMFLLAEQIMHICFVASVALFYLIRKKRRFPLKSEWLLLQSDKFHH